MSQQIVTDAVVLEKNHATRSEDNLSPAACMISSTINKLHCVAREIKICIRAVYYFLNSIARRTSIEIRESLTLPGPDHFLHL